MEALKPMVFYGSFETHGILQRFLNPWYFNKVLKPMVFYGGSERLLLWFRKIPENTFPRNDLTGETATLNK